MTTQLSFPPVFGTLVFETVQNGIPIKTYAEQGFQKIPPQWLSDEEYTKVLQSKLLANTDAVFINKERRTIFLAVRCARPMQGWWWLGGNTGNINTIAIDRLVGVIKRETNLSIDPSRFTLSFIGEYFWANRAQEPYDVGCHMLGLTFSVDVTDEEVKSVVLDPKEYGGVLVEFTRKDLVRERVFPAILDFYDTIFPPAT